MQELTKLDKFAITSMNVLIAINPKISNQTWEHWAKGISETAYTIAHAMLKESEKQNIQSEEEKRVIPTIDKKDLTNLIRKTK